jgi:hypothetical protein
VYEELGIDISIADEEILDQDVNPFETVKTLIDHLINLINEK